MIEILYCFLFILLSQLVKSYLSLQGIEPWSLTSPGKRHTCFMQGPWTALYTFLTLNDMKKSFVAAVCETY